MRINFLILSVFTAFHITAAHAETKTDVESLPWAVNLYFENDLFTASDKHYTNGVRASWVSPNINDFIDDPLVPVWAKQVNQQLDFLDPTPKYDNEVLRRLVFTLGQQIYTPSDTTQSTLDTDDRPYAGWLYSGVMYHARSQDTLNSMGMNLGIVGPAALGEELQNAVHRARGFDEWEGWDNQLDNELGLQFIFERKHRLLGQNNVNLAQDIGYDLIGHGGASLGNVATYLNTGAEFRLGWNLPSDMGTGSLRPGGDNSAPSLRHLDDHKYHFHTRNNALGVHVFIATDVKRVFHDIFLDGNTFSNSHSVDKELWVAEASIGFALLYQDTKLSFSRVHRTPEFKNQGEGHSYGSIALTLSF